jgi:glutaredoxin
MFCRRVREFLHQHQVAFVDRDITTDEAALDELQRLGVLTTPVTLIDGQVVVGYDVKRLSELLGI